MHSSIKQIAEEANVSTATVSRVFSGKDYVSADVKEKIISIAEKYGYSPKQYKKSNMSKSYLSTVGVIIPEIDSLFYCEIVASIQKILDEHEINMLLVSSNNSLQKERSLLAIFEQISVKALIIVPVSDVDDYNLSFVKDLQKKIPVILLDRDLRSETLDGVFMNNYSSAFSGLDILYKNGHRNIAYISGPDSSSSASERLNGFRDAMKQRNLPIKPEWVLQGGFDTDVAYTEVKKMLSHYPVGRSPVTAFFSASSKMLYGCIMALKEHGLMIGKDIAVLSFGRSVLSTENISHLLYPSKAMGEECAKILLERLDHTNKRMSTPKRRIIIELTEVLLGSEKFPAE